MYIAISGKQGSGKSTLADEFVTRFGFKKVSFAKALKELAMKEYGLTWEQAFGAEKDRELLQKLGKEKRDINPDYWVNVVLNEIADDPEQDYVLDDLRFLNEFYHLRDYGFIMVRIDSAEEVRRERLPNTFGNPGDISETDLDSVQRPDLIEFEDEKPSWDVFIKNNTIDLDQFKGVSESIYKAFTEKTDKI